MSLVVRTIVLVNLRGDILILAVTSALEGSLANIITLINVWSLTQETEQSFQG